MNKRLLFSYALLTSSFLSFPLSAECISSPDCTELGYDKTSCPSGDSILKCPFDTTKLKCIPGSCESIGKKTCGDMCVTDSYNGCCSNADCATGQICYNNTCEDLCGQSPYAVGDVYCNASGTPIGVVGHITNEGNNGIVVAADSDYDNSTIRWGCSVTDLSLTNYTVKESLNDFSGRANTIVIASKCGYTSAAYYYKNTYSKGGVSGWYLPAAGELYAILYTNFSAVNIGLSKISSNNQITSGKYYWTSSEYDRSTACVIIAEKYNYVRDKNVGINARCVLAF